MELTRPCIQINIVSAFTARNIDLYYVLMSVKSRPTPVRKIH